MNLLTHIQLMAEYNQWMNQKIYATAAALSAEQLQCDCQAFFGSVLGTLNHLMVGDIVWLKRFAAHPVKFLALEPLRGMEQPRSIDQMLYEDFGELRQQREQLDQIVRDWVNDLTEGDLDLVLDYQNMRAVPARRQLGRLLCHFFNHQTHHRGQVTTLLSQFGLDVGGTDLLNITPQVAE
ncbi:DinB family protein [filamentous cyanobacterium LEGE 11480]|uniref:DinB family protein n=1 Tax=Romeriopsis navalis LEGE 11480 TaxID=2777977 RepID=A0A928VL65_9CYAN|nr:DinB family protein [Romeriopsis navalis]MBE9029667.1 DinB family protein [Romeriopsis navalis LEGE 11480]